MDGSKTESFAQATDIWGRLVRVTNFVLDHWWLWLILGFLLWLFLKLRAQHELLGNLDERCGSAFADIDALLAERHALLPNLVETVKGFAGQEHKVLKDVIDARARAIASTGPSRLEAETQIGQSIMSLMAFTEDYPELASSQHFGELRAELSRIEDRISAARRFYNLAVEEEQAVRRAFPANLLAAFVPSAGHERFTLGERRDGFAEPVKVAF
jgi:LemA protein